MDEHEINVRRPLFDRLVDLEPRIDREARPLRTLDRAGLKESVRRELEQLFNTRCPEPAHRLPIARRTVLDYGVPDLAAFSPQNHDDRVQLGEILRRAALAYEPRLVDVRVHMAPVPGLDLALSATVEASVVIDGVAEPVSFQIVVSSRERMVKVHGGP